MAIKTNHVFKGHKSLLGSKFVTYGEVELDLKYELFSSSNGFDWGNNSSASIQLSFSILHQLSNETFASEEAKKFCTDVVSKFASRDWILNSSDVVDWIELNTNIDAPMEKSSAMDLVKPPLKKSKKKTNVVKDVCKKLEITQKNLASILEVPEGTVSSWAVKNEIPRLGKKAIEFYILNRKNQEVVDSYKNFVKLLQSA